MSYTLGTHITQISPQTRTMSVTMTWTPESSRQLKISLRASRTVCPSDLDLPPGIDERVWGSTLTGAQELTLDQYDGALIISPSENMVCSFLMLDGPVSATPVILEYDEVATVGNFACLSQEIGMSCWNTQTKHGMFLSRAETRTW